MLHLQHWPRWCLDDVLHTDAVLDGYTVQTVLFEDDTAPEIIHTYTCAIADEDKETAFYDFLRNARTPEQRVYLTHGVDRDGTVYATERLILGPTNELSRVAHDLFEETDTQEDTDTQQDSDMPTWLRDAEKDVRVEHDAPNVRLHVDEDSTVLLQVGPSFVSEETHLVDATVNDVACTSTNHVQTPMGHTDVPVEPVALTKDVELRDIELRDVASNIVSNIINDAITVTPKPTLSPQFDTTSSTSATERASMLEDTNNSAMVTTLETLLVNDAGTVIERMHGVLPPQVLRALADQRVAIPTVKDQKLIVFRKIKKICIGNMEIDTSSFDSVKCSYVCDIKSATGLAPKRQGGGVSVLHTLARMRYERR